MGTNRARGTWRLVRGGRRRLGAVCLFVFLMVFFGGCATSPPPHVTYTRQAWAFEDLPGTWLTTPHFDVYTTVTDERTQHGLATILENAYARLAEAFPPNPQAPTRATTYVFASRAQWERFTQAHYPGNSHLTSRIRAGGFTQGATSVLFFTTPGATLTTAAHETWHQYAHNTLPAGLPAWLDEGLACYFESFDFTHDPPTPTPRTNPLRLEHLRDALASNRLLSLGELLATDAGQVLAQDNSLVTQTYYAQLWALMIFLRHGPSRESNAGFEHLLKDMADGSLLIRVRAATIGQEDASPAALGRSVFALYFSSPNAECEAAYRQFLVDLAGLSSSPPTAASNASQPK